MVITAPSLSIVSPLIFTCKSLFLRIAELSRLELETWSSLFGFDSSWIVTFSRLSLLLLSEVIKLGFCETSFWMIFKCCACRLAGKPSKIQAWQSASSGVILLEGSYTRHFVIKSTKSLSRQRRIELSSMVPGTRIFPLEFGASFGDKSSSKKFLRLCALYFS